MECNGCGKKIGVGEDDAYQVRVGSVSDDDTFEPNEDVGYYCSECLSRGV